MISGDFNVPEGVRCISFVGGGGKTTLMMRLANQLAAEGKKVIVTTTTHMFRPGIPGAERQYPDNIPWLDREDEGMLRSLLAVSPVVIAGCPDGKNDRKICGFGEAFFRRMTELAEVVLVEADGSRRCPVKVPKAWEPVIPPETGLTYGVVGLSALGKTIREAVYDLAETAHFLGKTENEVLTEDDICQILSSEKGLRKSASGEYRVLLNQADTIREQNAAERILAGLSDGGICGQVFTRRDRIAVILLASGLSRRFGSNKLLEKLEDGKPMYLRTVELIEKVRTELRMGSRCMGNVRMECILVSSHAEILTQMEAREKQNRSGNGYTKKDGIWKTVRNDHPEHGISESIRLGVSRAGDVDGYLFCVCDQPDLRPETVGRLIDIWRSDGRGIAALSCQGRPGNPKLFSAAYRGQLLALEGDEGGKQIVRSCGDDMVLIEVQRDEELRDIDTGENWVSRRNNSACY